MQATTTEATNWETAYMEQYEATMKFIELGRNQTMKVMQLKKEMEALKKENEKLKEDLRLAKLPACDSCWEVDEHKTGRRVQEWDCYCCASCAPEKPDLEAIDNQIAELTKLRKTAKSYGPLGGRK